MAELLLKIPEDALQAARIPRDRLEPELLKELALQLYREGLLPSAGACKLAGMEKVEFQHLLGERGISQQLRPEDLGQDLENWEKWNTREE